MMQREYEKHGFFSFSANRNRELRCVKPGESRISTICRVLDLSRKEIRKDKDEKRALIYGILADDTAKLPFVAPEAREALVKNNVVRIENASVKRWEGLPALCIGRDTTLTICNEVIDFPPYSALIKPKNRTIGDIISCEGAFDVIVEGTIMSIREGSNKRTLVLDDGTGAVFLVVKDKEKEERIGFGMPITARGNVVDAENGYALMVEEVKVRGETFIINTMKNFLSRYT